MRSICLPRHRALRLLPALVAIALAGCSSQAWYESARVAAEQQCDLQPPAAQDDCRRRLNAKTYEEYERERAAAGAAPAR